jgi:hypothetical protein
MRRYRTDDKLASATGSRGSVKITSGTSSLLPLNGIYNSPGCCNMGQKLMALVAKIQSGGQTGADRAALDWAIEHYIPHSGWCPKGHRAEDGPIDGRYQLKKTPTASYLQRTEWNVRDSDGTVVFSIGEHLTGGPLKTVELAIEHQKPLLHLSAAYKDKAASELRQWIQQNNIRVLNVAGPRASKESTVAGFVIATLNAILEP